ncbi:SAM-dependent chlorinase/fluorinase [Flavobacteriaceae bacterium]|nr:SAM-dependent chlorinase/fluorinase [Flavobacteriaceae bacterium]
MSIITLTTDFGHKDYFVSVIKAALIQEAPSSMIIDISHEISPFNHTEAAYILKNAFANFPKGTIHIVGVDSELTPENQHVVMLYNGHFFIGANNGIFALIIEDMKYERIGEINIHNSIVSTFPVLDVFVKVAAHLARNGNMDVVAKPMEKLKEVIAIRPVINEAKTQLIGSVIYIDNFGNVVTNIRKKEFLEVRKTRGFTISVQTVKFNTIYNSYTEAINFDIPRKNREEEGKKIALWNAAGHLELSIYKSNPSKVGSAKSLFGVDFRTSITIEFE